ncbi:MAG: prolipoprotein diacylglyceryl transferase [Bacteroidales bacterium]|jgi:prolipoprotein diacylglyceryl transferase|nr:prolipoprotein diacylglyceryl transferase [Bacteroidales bacterium]
MYPKISDLINDLFGTSINLPIQSYGFMVAMAFVTGYLILSLELRRKEKEGILKSLTKKIQKGLPASPIDIATSAIFGFIIGLKIGGMFLDYSYFAEHPQDYIMSFKGSWVTAFLIAGLSAYLTWRSKEKEKLPKPITEEINIRPHENAASLVFVAALAGIAGAKLFDIVEHLDDFFADPMGSIFSFSGLAFYGGLIVAAFAVVWKAKKLNIKLPYISDSAAPALMLAYAVGRIGCHISGDGCWGIPNELPQPEWLSFLPSWMWAFDYPHNVINAGILIPDCHGSHCHVLGTPVFPTALYEFMICGLFFLVLWGIRKRIHISGVLFGIYLMLNATERFIIEKIRINIQYDIALGIKATQAEMIAIGIFLTGVFWVLWFVNQHKKAS